MAFWQVDGHTIDGSAENANSGSFSLIPDDTIALASIKEMDRASFGEEPYYINVQWKIQSGPFKGAVVFQKIKVNEADKNKRAKHLNMLMRIFKMAQKSPPPGEPEKMHYMQLLGTAADIHIREWEQEGKKGNWISALYPPNTESAKQQKESANMAAEVQAATEMFGDITPTASDDEIPF